MSIFRKWWWGGVYERYWRFLERMLQDGKNDGSVRRDVDPALYARAIIAAHTGMLVEWFVTGKALDVGPFVRTFRDMILRSVTA